MWNVEIQGGVGNFSQIYTYVCVCVCVYLPSGSAQVVGIPPNQFYSKASRKL